MRKDIKRLYRKAAVTPSGAIMPGSMGYFDPCMEETVRKLGLLDMGYTIEDVVILSQEEFDRLIAPHQVGAEGEPE